jgi:hypothetical protein
MRDAQVAVHDLGLLVGDVVDLVKIPDFTRYPSWPLNIVAG